ncbi:hypothetical protein IWQ57_002292 [Coemansia nantahalensis]|uniref:Uncharacterized protein n=1 Tax=Coemansia nantahalensis TaxID=2789366 RepID=A0ACC1K1B3_9FUNG|nr:hypothetical protein IWQ57_002292 [Coemansia nantahalensis]
MSSTVSAGPEGSAPDDVLPLDSLRVHHTQALVNIVDSALQPDPLDAARLLSSLAGLRRHLESPRSCMHGHPATETSAVAVAERVLFCWVCARAGQADAQAYGGRDPGMVVDSRFGRYADVSEEAVSETIQSISYMATMGVGAAAVAQTSIPISLVLVLGFTDSAEVHTCALRALTKLCTKHSIRRARAGARWKTETGLYAVLDALSRAQAALGLRNRFDAVANGTHSFAVAIAATASLPTPPPSAQEVDPGTCHIGSRCASTVPAAAPAAERPVASALAFVNALVDAHATADERLRIRKELLDTPLCEAMRLVEDLAAECPRAVAETRRFRRAYSHDIHSCDTRAQRSSLC